MAKWRQPRRVNGAPIVIWEVEEHCGGKGGVGKGPRTGTYADYTAAMRAMTAAHAAGNGVTCIGRNRFGPGRVFVLGMVEAW